MGSRAPRLPSVRSWRCGSGWSLGSRYWDGVRRRLRRGSAHRVPSREPGGRRPLRTSRVPPPKRCLLCSGRWRGAGPAYLRRQYPPARGGRRKMSRPEIRLWRWLGDRRPPGSRESRDACRVKSALGNVMWPRPVKIGAILKEEGEGAPVSGSYLPGFRVVVLELVSVGEQIASLEERGAVRGLFFLSRGF